MSRHFVYYKADKLQAHAIYDAAETKILILSIAILFPVLVAQAESALLAADKYPACPKNTSRPIL